jgi:Copper type II ascorbate-dependent monooxygenase, C-terminal domain
MDSSGVEIFYSTTPRPVEMGVMQVGDPMVGLFGQPVGDGLSGHHFECPDSCSDAYLSDGQPVTVIREYLHMHISGTRTVNEHIREGEVIRTASTEVWDFDQNGNVPMKQQPYEIYPGDAFRMSCYYRGNEASKFGLGSRDEMCMAFLYYYPRKTITLPTPEGNFSLPWTCGYAVDWLGPACNATYEPEGILESEEDMHRLFGKQPEGCLLSTDATAENPGIVLEPEAAVQDETTEESTVSVEVPTPEEPDSEDMDVISADDPSHQVSSGSNSLRVGCALYLVIFAVGFF